jgi:hypothetical protein
LRKSVRGVMWRPNDTYQQTDYTILWNRLLPEKLTVAQLVKFYYCVRKGLSLDSVLSYINPEASLHFIYVILIVTSCCRVVKKKNVMSLAGLGTKNDCAGKSQQQFTCVIPWCRLQFMKLIFTLLVRKFFASCRRWKVNIEFTRICYLSLFRTHQVYSIASLYVFLL